MTLGFLRHAAADEAKGKDVVRRIREEEGRAFETAGDMDALIADLRKLKGNPDDVIRYFNDVLEHNRKFKKAFGAELLDGVYELSSGDIRVPLRYVPLRTPSPIMGLYIQGRIEGGKADACAKLIDSMIEHLMRG